MLGSFSTIEAQDFQGHVYVLGHLHPVFPSNSVKNEFYRVAQLTPKDSLTSDIFYNTLSQHNYLARAMCWVWEVDSVETYIVIPRDSATLKQFVESLNTAPNQVFLEGLVGDLGPVASPNDCYGKQLPLVLCHHFEVTTQTDFVTLIVNETRLPQNEAQSVLSNLLRLTNIAGNTNEQRAVNFLTYTYFELYKYLGTQLHPSSPDVEIFRYGAVRSEPVPETGDRTVLSIIFEFPNPQTAIQESCYVRVDVTERYPFVTGTLAEGTPES